MPATFPSGKPNVANGSLWNYGPWGGDCELRIQPDGEIWMVRLGKGTDGTGCWKTKNGDGSKLTNQYGKKVNLLWDNHASV